MHTNFIKYLLALLFYLPFTLTAQQPNILLIIADDLGVDPLNGYHRAGLMATTPNLDSLRAAGLTFINGSATPVCSPTRATIMTGRYGSKTGVLGVPGNLASNQPTVFSNLAGRTRNAYATALIGKWHLTNRAQPDSPLAFGMDHYDGYLSGAPANYYDWTQSRDGRNETATEYVTTALTDAALDWIGTQTKPWFCWLAHAAPHTPYHVPPAEMFTINNPQTNLQQYIAMIEALDFEVGRLLRSLEPEVRENTLVIFVGDNGTPNNVMQIIRTVRARGLCIRAACGCRLSSPEPGLRGPASGNPLWST